MEARQLPGANISPIARVSCVGQGRETRVRKSTNSPHWNETFTFNYFMSPAELFDEVVTFAVSWSFCFPWMTSYFCDVMEFRAFSRFTTRESCDLTLSLDHLEWENITLNKTKMHSIWRILYVFFSVRCGSHLRLGAAQSPSQVAPPQRSRWRNERGEGIPQDLRYAAGCWRRGSSKLLNT